MADKRFVRPGANRGAADVDSAYFHDNADGTYDMAEASHLRGWDTTDLAWYRLPVDHSTGALQTSGAAAASGSTAVTSGSITVTNTSFKLLDASGTNLASVNTSGQQLVNVGNAPSVTVTSGSVTVTNTSFNVGNAPSVTVTSGSITATNTGFKVLDASGTNQASVNTSGQQLVNVGNAPSVTVTSGSITATNAGFKVLDASGTNQASVNTSGQQLVNVGNAPSVTVTSGSVTVTNTSFSVGNAPSVTVTSGSITATNAGFKIIDAGGTNQASVNTSGQVLVRQGQDTSRTFIQLYADRAVPVTSEGMYTMSRTSGTASLATSAGYTVTSGKTLRIQRIGGFVVTNTTTGLTSRTRLRVATTNNVLSTSASMVQLDITAAGAVAQVGGTEEAIFPDGVEIAGGNTVGVSHVDSATTGSVGFSLVGFEY